MCFFVLFVVFGFVVGGSFSLFLVVFGFVGVVVVGCCWLLALVGNAFEVLVFLRVDVVAAFAFVVAVGCWFLLVVGVVVFGSCGCLLLFLVVVGVFVVHVVFVIVFCC